MQFDKEMKIKKRRRNKKEGLCVLFFVCIDLNYIWCKRERF